MKELYVLKIEFYITNVCNFNCTGCNRFNNINFSGHQRWEDYRATYEKWATHLTFDSFTILGGEPMTNPDYLDWLSGVHKLWPDAKGSFLTNGHYLTASNQALYDILQNSNGNITLDIGLHNEQRVAVMLEKIDKFLKGKKTIVRTPDDIKNIPNFSINWVNSYNQIRDSSWPDCNTIDDWDVLPEHIRRECELIHKFSPDIISESVKGWKITDENGVVATISHQDQFNQGSLIIDPGTKKLTLHQSSAIVAHSACSFVIAKCYNFIKGKLYKCGPVALFPELDQKFSLDLDLKDKQLIYAYKAGDIDSDSIPVLKEFIKNIDNPIDQCKFCPENYLSKKIFAEHGKKKFVLKHIK